MYRAMTTSTKRNRCYSTLHIGGRRAVAAGRIRDEGGAAAIGDCPALPPPAAQRRRGGGGGGGAATTASRTRTAAWRLTTLTTLVVVDLGLLAHVCSGFAVRHGGVLRRGNGGGDGQRTASSASSSVLRVGGKGGGSSLDYLLEDPSEEDDENGIHGGGGRAPTEDDMPSLDFVLEDPFEDEEEEESDDPSSSTGASLSSKSSRARLTVVQITDVYTLENFPSLKTLLAEKRAAASPGTEVISMLTGDFLAPYLLSSVDKGEGMMRALASTPVDYLTWGNHEADVDHRTVRRHVRQWRERGGKWINSNMVDYAEMESQQEYDVVEVCSQDGTNVRRVGLVGVLSDDPSLYAHFKSPGAFGGATVTDPWTALSEYKTKLESSDTASGGENCDVVLPLQHTYVPDDHRTCREFDFPVVLSGHDHHRVDEVVDGTRLLKPGLDGIYATVLDLTWDDADQLRGEPHVRAKFVRCDDYEPDPQLEEQCVRAYDALLPLRNTELARIPPSFAPLSSVNSRGCVCTMGRFLCTLVLSSLNTARRQREHKVDAVLLMGGNVRGGTDYSDWTYFSLEALEAEMKPDEVLGVVDMPGWVLKAGIEATHEGDPIPGWMQYDDGIKEVWTTVTDEEGNLIEGGGTPEVTHVKSEKIDLDRVYRVATKISDLTNGQSPPLTDYYTSHPESLPPKGSYVNIHAELMAYFARNVWRKIWEAVSPEARIEEECVDEDEPCGIDVEPGTCDPEGRFDALDRDGTGILTVDEIHAALKDVVGLKVDDTERSLAEFVHGFADTSGDGRVTLRDFERFCEEMPGVYENQRWRLAFPRRKRTEEEEDGTEKGEQGLKGAKKEAESKAGASVA